MGSQVIGHACCPCASWVDKTTHISTTNRFVSWRNGMYGQDRARPEEWTICLLDDNTRGMTTRCGKSFLPYIQSRGSKQWRPPHVWQFECTMYEKEMEAKNVKSEIWRAGWQERSIDSKETKCSSCYWVGSLESRRERQKKPQERNTLKHNETHHHMYVCMHACMIMHST